MIPWRDEETLRIATNLACDVRELSPDDIAAELRKWPPRKLSAVLIAAAALVDVDTHLYKLLAWDSQPAKFSDARLLVESLKDVCKAGHRRTHQNTRVDVNGTTLRCRVCERDYRKQLRRRRRNARDAPGVAA